MIRACSPTSEKVPTAAGMTFENNPDASTEVKASPGKSKKESTIAKVPGKDESPNVKVDAPIAGGTHHKLFEVREEGLTKRDRKGNLKEIALHDDAKHRTQGVNNNLNEHAITFDRKHHFQKPTLKSGRSSFSTTSVACGSSSGVSLQENPGVTHAPVTGWEDSESIPKGPTRREIKHRIKCSKELSDLAFLGNRRYDNKKVIGIPTEIYVKNLCIRTPKIKILRHVTIALKSGELNACLGPSGAGKSSLFDFITGRNIQANVTSGLVVVNGKKVTPAWQSRNIAYVEQDISLLSTSTVREALTFAARIQRSGEVTMEFINNKVDKTLEILQLKHRQPTLPSFFPISPVLPEAQTLNTATFVSPRLRFQHIESYKKHRLFLVASGNTILSAEMLKTGTAEFGVYRGERGAGW
mmetsp:Transcript_4730/g.7293  ORF Transcript_4730/g.7293 Transcript_4730/m.7293 type:complete len:412 (-) Transcript_4730:1272-2507(-)